MGLLASRYGRLHGQIQALGQRRFTPYAQKAFKRATPPVDVEGEMRMDKTLIGLTAVTVAGYAICAWTRPELAAEGWHEAMEMLMQAVPWILVSMFAAGLIAQLFDPAAIALWLGPKSGVIGITLAAFLGLVGTGSRFAVYPL